ncbi:MAG: ribosomal protein S6 [Planctomycetota bacterium]
MDHTRTYECMCLLDNREVRKGWESAKDSVAAIFTKHSAKILSSRRWDERRLAYPMNGQVRATYLLIYIEIETGNIPVLRRDLQFSDALLRYMITDCPDVPEGAYEPEEEFDVNAIPEDDAPDVVEAPAEEAAASDKPADGEAKADEGEAKADEGEAKAAEGDAKAAEAATEDKPAEEKPADGDAAPATATDGEETK